MELSLRHLEEQDLEVKEQLESLLTETKLTAAELAEIDKLQQRLTTIDREIETASPQLGTLRIDVAALQRKILDVGGSKLSRAQAKVDILTKQFETLSATLSTKEVEEANLRKQAAKAAAARAKSEEDCNKAQQKLTALLKEQEEMEEDAAKVSTHGSYLDSVPHD